MVAGSIFSDGTMRFAFGLGVAVGCISILLVQRLLGILVSRGTTAGTDLFEDPATHSTRQSKAPVQKPSLRTPGIVTPPSTREALVPSARLPQEVRLLSRGEHYVTTMAPSVAPPLLGPRSPSQPPDTPAWLPAPLEEHLADGQRSLSGPTSEGGWQTLTFVPAVEALRYECKLRGKVKHKMQILGVTLQRWDAIALCATMGTWQAAVQRLVQDATQAQQVTDLPLM